MGYEAFAVIALGAVAAGYMSEHVGSRHYAGQALVAGAGMVLGMFGLSVLVRAVAPVGPEVGGLLLVPGLLGGLLLSAVADLAARGMASLEEA